MIGPNGAGKSTFVRTALGLVRAGRAARSSAAPGLRLAYVPQQSALDAIFPVSVLDFVLMGLQGRATSRCSARRARRRRGAGAALDEAGARALARRQLRDLSGGQRQRVLMARALATDADLVFLDEPTRRWTPPRSARCSSSIERLRAKRGAAVVMVTHLVEDGLERADRALLLDRDHGVALARPPRRAARACPSSRASTAASSAARRGDRRETP